MGGGWGGVGGGGWGGLASGGGGGGVGGGQFDLSQGVNLTNSLLSVRADAGQEGSGPPPAAVRLPPWHSVKA